MSRYTIEFDDKYTISDQLEQLAAELKLTPEQLIMRFVIDGLIASDPSTEPCILGTSLDDFLIKNGVMKRIE